MATKETPIEIMQNLMREYKLSAAGFGSYVRIIDEVIKLAEEHPECIVEHPKFIDDELAIRKSFTDFVKSAQTKVKLLEEEIEREKHYPSEAPMIYRLMILLGPL